MQTHRSAVDSCVGPPDHRHRGERGACGREKGEDTLREMGWRADLSPEAPKPQPVKPPSVQWTAPVPDPPTEEQTAPPAPRVIVQSAGPAPRVAPPWGGGAPTMPRRQRKRRGRAFSRLIFFIVLIVIVAATFGSLIKVGQDTIDKSTNAIKNALPVPTTHAKV